MTSVVQVSYAISDSEADAEDTSLESEDVEIKIEPESDSENESHHDEDTSHMEGQVVTEDVSTGHKGLADVMAKILVKQTPTERSVILSKGQTDQELAKKPKKTDENVGFQVVTNEETQKVSSTHQVKKEVEIKMKGKDKALKKKSWEELGRVRPNPLLKDRERTLQRMATRGVVQLFNAVNKQQGMLREQLAEIGGSEIRREKVMQSMTKGKFMDILKDTSTKAEFGRGERKLKKEVKSEPDMEEETEKPSWGVLREDFLMGGKMTNWDKEDSGSEDGASDPDINDSDFDT